MATYASASCTNASYARPGSCCGSTRALNFDMLMMAPNDLPTLRNYYAQVSMVDENAGRILDAVIAKNDTESGELWRLGDLRVLEIDPAGVARVGRRELSIRGDGS